MKNSAKNLVFSNQSGFITVDFLFAFVLILGFSAVLFALTFTLTVVEVAQYSTFAAARIYLAGHKSETIQRQVAANKFNELTTKNRVFAPLFKNGWYKVQEEPWIGDISNYMSDYATSEFNAFWGAATTFNAPILQFQIPLFGSTDPNDKGFKTTIGSYLGREPSAQECTAFAKNRWIGIRALRVSGGVSYQTNTTPAGFTAFIDDGC